MNVRPRPSPATDAAIRPGAVRLKVLDLGRVRDFYARFIGLRIRDQGPRHVSLGTTEATLLHLETAPGITTAGRRAAGLFHTAFLLPDREALGAWLIHAAKSGAPIVGASDHIVSEAIYLTDPEGNGVEIYADRARAHWHDPDGAIHMSTGPLDLNELASSATDLWTGFHEFGALGHVHLQVGNLAQADAFWKEVMGLDLTTSYPGASFYATGGYHHHIAANIWNSKGAPARSDTLSGLSEIQFMVREPDLLEEVARRARASGHRASIKNDALCLSDPWNISLCLKGIASHAD